MRNGKELTITYNQLLITFVLCLLRKCIQISCDVISDSTIDIPSLIIDGCWWSDECCMLVVLSILILLSRSLKWDVKPMIATNGNMTFSSTQMTSWSIRVSTGTLTTLILVWTSAKLVKERCLPLQFTTN